MNKILKFFRFDNFIEYYRKTDWLLFTLISIFTIGSWLDISGIWCELPLIVDNLPERWRLPSILNIITQFGHIGPFIYLCLRRFFPRILSFSNAICIVLGLGSLSCVLLAFFWNKTEIVFGEERSIYLYIFNFMLSILDSLSTITFLPYIGENFSKEYIIPNYIGESLSALIPGLLSIIQGIGNSGECLNVTITNNWTHKETIKPKFSVSVYFGLLSILIAFCLAAFCITHFSNLFDKIRKKEADKLILKKSQVTDIQFTKEKIETKLLTSFDKKLVGLFMGISFIASFLQYGFLPGLISYATMPYGSDILYLSITLSNCLLPISILLSIGSHQVTIKQILIEAILPVILAIYVIYIAAFSPCPPFLNTKFNLGGYFIVFCWVFISSFFIRVRCLIATRLENYGKNYLVSYGVSSQFGQIIGGVIIYILVDVLRIFKDKPKCSSFNICVN